MLEVRLILRFAHMLAATIWVGGSILYLVAVAPALRGSNIPPELARQIAAAFKRMVTLCIGVLLVSGAFLTFDRLTETNLGWSYLVVLGLKVALALLMFVLAIYLGQSGARRLAKRSTRISREAPQLIVVFGIIVFFLGALLNDLFVGSMGQR